MDCKQKQILTTLFVVLTVGVVITEVIFMLARSDLSRRMATINVGMTIQDVREVLETPSREGSPVRPDKHWQGLWYSNPKMFLPVGVSEYYVEFYNDVVVRVEEQPAANIIFSDFDWKRSSPSRRGAMVRDLLATKVLNGLDKEGVRDRLGTAGNELDINFGSEWEYEIGIIPGKYGTHKLNVRFDQIGAVVSYSIVSD